MYISIISFELSSSLDKKLRLDKINVTLLLLQLKAINIRSTYSKQCKTLLSFYYS